MKASIRELFPHFYDDTQTRSSVEYVGMVDRMLIEDGTYFVADVDGEPVACGGWSRRDRLYTGSGDAPDDSRLLDSRPAKTARIRAMFVRSDWTRHGLGRAILEACEDAARRRGPDALADGTLPGVPLYAHYGFEIREENIQVRLPDGVLIPCAAMEKQVAVGDALQRDG